METFNFRSSLEHINESNFENIALSLFEYQYKNNLLYRTFADLLGKDPSAVHTVNAIPFLPIRFFKTHTVSSGTWTPEAVFTSSATTGMTVSSHVVDHRAFYLANTTAIFNQFYGPPRNYHFLALLPSYQERSGSSLIAMIDHFIQSDESGHSGYFLSNYDELLRKIEVLRNSNKKVILWGVSFALLDLAERQETDLSHCVIMETGGMKGRRKEWVREEFHRYLRQRFNAKEIHSEYGMTELLSQAYSHGEGYFRTPPWMKICVRDIHDPFLFEPMGSVGALNVIDLANSQSCAFVETEDLGRILGDGSFEVLGRADNSDIRGCNLLVG